MSAGLLQTLTGNRAGTGPAHEDPRFRGRVYGIPFEKVWNEALRMAGGGIRGWSIHRASDQDGRIEAEAVRLITRSVDDVEVRITLDSDGQTRVDVTSRSRSQRPDLGANRRRILHFLREMDSRLGVTGR